MTTTFEFVRHIIQASDLEEEKKRSALSNAYHASLDEIDILHGVFEIKATWRFAGEILRGAHVRIFDMGERYDDWKKLPSADTRHSSHRSEGPQYHVNGRLVHTVLLGKIWNRTWLQLEGHPQGIRHVIDWVKYNITHENQGPYGSSRYIENRPLEIQPLHPHVVITHPRWVRQLTKQGPSPDGPFR